MTVSEPARTQNQTDLTRFDTRKWIAKGLWVTARDTAGEDPIMQARTWEQAADIVRDHNSAVVEIERLRAEVAEWKAEAAKAWSFTETGGGL